MEETKADTAAVITEVVETVDKPATLAVAMVTCLVRFKLCLLVHCVTDPSQATAPRARSATTVAKLVIFPETAQLRPRPSELATSASNLATSRLSALTRAGV